MLNKKATPAYLERRTQILKAAGEVLDAKGYHQASMQEIADRSGILKQTLYYYFSSKEELFYELIAGEHSLALVRRYFEADEALEDRSAPARLRMFVVQWMEFTVARSPGFIAAEREFQQLSAERLAFVVEFRKILPSLLESIIEAGVDEGVFLPSVNPSVAARNISAMLRDIYVWYDPAGPATPEEIVEWQTAFTLRGLGYPA